MALINNANNGHISWRINQHHDPLKFMDNRSADYLIIFVNIQLS